MPWRFIADWECKACGDCCRLYSVVINFREWFAIVKNYGVEQTSPGLSRLFIKRRGDGSCAFLSDFSTAYKCGIQHMKPQACKIWPFKILIDPQFGYANEAFYRYGENNVFVYADSMCSGLRYGKPTWKFMSHSLKEFVEIGIGFREHQFMTTANLSWFRPYASYCPNMQSYR